jgi:hypothetical protein
VRKYRYFSGLGDMYFIHQNPKLHQLFSIKPYQGANPATAQFLFFGLDANYDPDIGDKHCFSEVVSYLEDGVQYWKERGYHHPFRHPDYRGDGAPYHRRFAEIGFVREHAELVSFVELIDVPTYGGSNLRPSDLKLSHLDRLKVWVLNGRAAYIFIPPTVGRLLRRTPQFSWLPKEPISYDGSLPVMFRSDQKVVYAPYHFSCVGKNCLKKNRDFQIKAIGNLIS